MAALVQTVPQQTGTITLLQPRPASSQSSSQSQPPPLGLQQQQPHQQQQLPPQQQSQPQQMARGRRASSYNNNYNFNNHATGYRGTAPTQPVAPYAFTSTPSLASQQPRPPSQLTGDSRTLSDPAVSGTTKHTTATPTTYPGIIPPRGGGLPQEPAASMSSSSAASSTRGYGYHPAAKAQDDFALPSRTRMTEGSRPRPVSSSAADLMTLTPLSVPPTLQTPLASQAKPSPDRYRRGQRRGGAEQHSGTPYSSVAAPAPVTSTSATTTTANAKEQAADLPSFAFPADWNTNKAAGHTRGGSADDAQIKKTHSTPDLAKRYRRRSVGSLDPAALMDLSSAPIAPSNQDNNNSNKFTLPEIPSVVGDGPARPTSSGSSDAGSSQLSGDNTSHRPADAKRSSKNPSPLSNNLSMNNDDVQPQQEKKKKGATKKQNVPESPAAKQLTEISKKGRKKSGKSRLRRAFSFGSAADMEAAAQKEAEDGDNQTTSRKQQLDDELGAEQAAIAEKQEAGGLGENIYSGQGGIFSGSTDNLSLSSTASSASMMLRKMGKGMKKGTRSIVSAFRRDKLGAQGAESSEPGPTVEPTTPQVSMVTVEAQPQMIPVAVPRDSMEGRGPSRDGAADYGSEDDGGGAGWGGEESTSSYDHNNARKSIIGGDRERAEVLAAVRKGILKKTGSNSPVVRPADASAVAGMNVPHMNGSPQNSTPNSPADHLPPPRSGHRRTDSVTIEGDDYFLPAGRVSASNVASAPVTPQSARNISFSPRIQFHDTFPSGEYDRRGEASTCNRLTPLLAQQIKEELNTFKMEMEVHESSKVYTHFF